jgi:hypothetical protein
MKRQVTERDFRMPEFRDADPQDYEFRADGKLVRKDRWETAIRSICGLVGQSVREFEIPDVVESVRELAADSQGWNQISIDGHPDDNCVVDVRLIDGSRLRKVRFAAEVSGYTWEHNGQTVTLDYVVAWRERDDKLITSGT